MPYQYSTPPGEKCGLVSGDHQDVIKPGQNGQSVMIQRKDPIDRIQIATLAKTVNNTVI
jgi:hypothetical protein